MEYLIYAKENEEEKEMKKIIKNKGRNISYGVIMSAEIK